MVVSTTLSVSISGAVVFSFAGSFDRSPFDAVGRADELALRHTSTRAGSLSFINCAYSGRMLFFSVEAAQGRARNASTAMDLSFFTATVYEDEVRAWRMCPWGVGCWLFRTLIVHRYPLLDRPASPNMPSRLCVSAPCATLLTTCLPLAPLCVWFAVPRV